MEMSSTFMTPVRVNLLRTIGLSTERNPYVPLVLDGPGRARGSDTIVLTT
jgi:hypothetical protein